MSDNVELNIKDTVNLPKTDFPIRAGLVNKEPEIIKYWQKIGLDKLVLEKQQQSKESYILHDGPPYPNGEIHMGHALNKVLKDIVVRSKSMQGYNAPYVPGWDCHGLPIEVQLIKQLKKEGREDKKHNIPWFRENCKEFALKYVDIQKKDFQRLGITGRWDDPYLTLNSKYEAKVIELFGQMAENGLVYKGQKPIHWCPTCETALAEAEIEYSEIKSPSIFVKFKVSEATEKLAKIIGSHKASILVWTTTPWTLPANVAIAAHPDFNYLVLETDKGILVLVEELLSNLSDFLELGKTEILGKIKGQDIAGTVTEHPFYKRTSKIYPADYVTKEDGSGFVHTAPGHGMDDYTTSQKHDLPILMPVDSRGQFTEHAPEWSGVNVFEANKAITQSIEAKGNLVKLSFIKHSYPHCWRCKNPIIFRATEQWFIAMDKKMKNNKTLREMALETIKKEKWVPAWGEKRIYTMIENRPDWCISRQRFWGIPIPVISCDECNHSEMTGAFNQAIKKLVEKEGTKAWFEKEANEILPKELVCSKCGKRNFRKEADILDVWFESGSSFASVLEIEPELDFPADLYLEGSDQHRGWFQSSLLIGLGARQLSPYKSVLTHGFTVDEKGRKMSKSEGNVISPHKVIQNYGADILRWWLAGSDFKNDICISDDILKQASETFSKTRNTIRFLLSNLYDFDPDKNALKYAELQELDQWILLKLNELTNKVIGYHSSFDFHLIVHNIHDFCATQLSSNYLDLVKDRLYCDGANSPTRRRTQTAIYHILDTLLKLLAPLLVFTTEDAYSFFNKSAKKQSIHLEELPKDLKQYENKALADKFKTLTEIKDKVYQKLEQMRLDKEIRSFLETKITLTLPEPIDFSDWESWLIVSQAEIKTGKELKIEIQKLPDTKCVRCWKYLPLEQGLCERCRGVVKSR